MPTSSKDDGWLVWRAKYVDEVPPDAVVLTPRVKRRLIADGIVHPVVLRRARAAGAYEWSDSQRAFVRPLPAREVHRND